MLYNFPTHLFKMKLCPKTDTVIKQRVEGKSQRLFLQTLLIAKQKCMAPQSKNRGCKSSLFVPFSFCSFIFLLRGIPAGRLCSLLPLFFSPFSLCQLFIFFFLCKASGFIKADALTNANAATLRVKLVKRWEVK